MDLLGKCIMMNEQVFDVILDVIGKEDGNIVSMTYLYNMLEEVFKDSKYKLEIIPCVNGHYKLLLKLTEK